MRNWTSRQSEVMYETDRVVTCFLISKDEGKKICASYRPSEAEGNRIFHAHGKAGTPTGYTDDLRWRISEKKDPKVYRK